jgi:hypothetical protein
VTGIAALRSKWAAGKAVRAGQAERGSISESIRDRGATQPPAHFHRNPPGRASFGRLLCRSSVQDHRRVFSLFASRIQPKYAAAPLYQSRTWCTNPRMSRTFSLSSSRQERPDGLPQHRPTRSEVRGAPPTRRYWQPLDKSAVSPPPWP